MEGCILRAEGENCKVDEVDMRPVQHEDEEAEQCFYHNHPDRLDWICPVDGCHLRKQTKRDEFCALHRPQ